MATKQQRRKSVGKIDHLGAVVSLVETNQSISADIERFLRDRDAWVTERSWLRAMIDQVPDYLFVKDTECRFVVANKSVAADLGRGDPNDILGKTDLDLHPSDLAKGFYDNEQRVLHTGEPMLDIEEFVVLQSGQKRWLSTSKLPLRNAQGQIIGLVGIARDITDRKRSEDEVRYLAFHDTLTGLPNRRSFEGALSTMIAGFSPDETASVLYVDLDRFKYVNDTLGHSVGDALIREVAKRLEAALSDENLVARIGGDEFAVLIGPDSSVSAENVATNIIAQLGRSFSVLGNVVQVAGSVGVTRARQGMPPDSVLREADIALYEAKARGRGCWVAFAAPMATALEEKAALERDLRLALLTGDQLFLEYQPVFDADAKAIVGAEALVRWHHPSRGRLPPGVFIELAEERGLITQLGDWALEQACEVVSGSALPWVAVNVSPIQMRNPDFASRLLFILATANIEPSRLQIEITEGVFLDDRDKAVGVLRTLREAGIKVAIDDFGTGYSSLAYLDHYNVDKLKIDQSFVAKLGTSKSADAIVRCIVALARATGIRVTAEGVETEEQRAHLAAIGCHELQGFLLARSMDPSKLLGLLTGRDPARSAVTSP
ncbi:MAG: EAL domain-containing protein [Devosia sp.]